MSDPNDLVMATLLQKLFLSIIQKSDKTLTEDYVNYFKKILSSRFFLIQTNESSIINMLFDKAQKIHLSNSKNNIEKIERLQTLYSILSTKKVPSKRWACLYLLLGLSQGANEQQGFGASILETILKKQSENRKDILPLDIINPSQLDNNQIEIGNEHQFKQSSPIVVNVSKTSKIITERELINDLMFVFQGIDGHFITYNSTKNAYCLNSMIPFNENISDIVSVLVELGWLYRKVTKHLIFFNESNIPSQFIQSFSYAVQNELNEYYKLISFFKKKNLKDDKDQEFQQKVVSPSSSDDLSLKNLLLWTLEPIERMKWLAISCEAVYTLRGTAITSQLYSYVNYSGAEPYLSKVLEEICKPFFSFIKNWIGYGDLQDPHKEFFVNVLDKVNDDDIWKHKYQIIYKNIPNFLDKDLSIKIFEIGKCVNFIRIHCNETAYNLTSIKAKLQNELNACEHQMDVDSLMIEDSQSNNNKIIEENIDAMQSNKTIKKTKVIDIKSYRSCLSFLNLLESNEAVGMTFLSQLITEVDLIHALVNKDVVDIIYNKYHFKENLNSINRYLLLGQGDMMESLMESLFEKLKKSALHILKHDLQASLDTAIIGTNAFHNDPECLKKLNIKLLDQSIGDTGWDIFVLEYNVEVPLTVIFNHNLLKEYQKLFFFFWKLKRIEYSQSHQIWRKFMSYSQTIIKNYESMRKVIHKSVLFNQQVIHFVSNLHNFIALEVLETQYKKIIDILPSIDKLDTLIDVHKKFVENIIVQSLLNQDSSVIYKKILEIFDLILRFRTALDVLTMSFLEVNYEAKSKAKDDYSSGFNTNTKISEEAFKQIGILFEEYKTQITDLINSIELCGKGNMKYLAIKLDYNYYYSQVEKDNDHKRQQNRIDNIKVQEENRKDERDDNENEEYEGNPHYEEDNNNDDDDNNNDDDDNNNNDDISMNQFNSRQFQSGEDEEIIAPKKRTYEVRKEDVNEEDHEQNSYQHHYTSENQNYEEEEENTNKNNDDNEENTNKNNDDNEDM